MGFATIVTADNNFATLQTAGECRFCFENYCESYCACNLSLLLSLLCALSEYGIKVPDDIFCEVNCLHFSKLKSSA